MIAINVPANKAWSLLPQDDPESYRPDDLIELGGRRFWESLADLDGALADDGLQRGIYGGPGFYRIEPLGTGFLGLQEE